MDAAAPGTGTDGETKKEEVAMDRGKKVSFMGLFRYSDGTDLLLMLVGTVAALANGMSQPVMTVIFGDVIDAFGGATTGNVLNRVNTVSMSLCPPPFRPAGLLLAENGVPSGLPCSIELGRCLYSLEKAPANLVDVSARTGQHVWLFGACCLFCSLPFPYSFAFASHFCLLIFFPHGLLSIFPQAYMFS
jgi:ATP-binding cassette subfamily B (MDR/TAP) protein 1